MIRKVLSRYTLPLAIIILCRSLFTSVVGQEKIGSAEEV